MLTKEEAYEFLHVNISTGMKLFPLRYNKRKLRNNIFCRFGEFFWGDHLPPCCFLYSAGVSPIIFAKAAENLLVLSYPNSEAMSVTVRSVCIS